MIFEQSSHGSQIADIVRSVANDMWQLGLSEEQLAQFIVFAQLLVEWNLTKMNLTRLTSPHDIAVNHFLDSLAIVHAIDMSPGSFVLDLGAGAGLPGIALKIARPYLNVVLLDSTAKKLVFCREVIDQLGLRDIETVHARAEDASRLPKHAAVYDFVTARAVAPLGRLLPWCAPFLCPSGTLIAMKGAGAPVEISAAARTANKLGLEFLATKEVLLPDAEEAIVRNLVMLRQRRTKMASGTSTPV